MDMQGGDRNAVSQMNAIVELLERQGVMIRGRYANDYNPTRKERPLHTIREVSKEYRTYDLISAPYEYLGNMVELAPTEELFDNPIHPYTQALLSAIPIPELGHRRERVKLTGEITSPIEPPAECRFAARCPLCNDSICRKAVPELIEVRESHFVACPLKQAELGFQV